MNLSRRSKPYPRLAALISLIIVNIRLCGAETSGEYLQKAMIELQELNMPSNSITMHDRLAANHYQYAGYKGDYNQDKAHRKLSTSNAHQDIRQQEKPSANNNALPDQAQSAANNIVQYYAVRDSVPATSYPKVKQPQEPLVLTRAKLAAMYKQALEKGSAISVAALTQALNAAGGNGNATPQVGHLQLPVKYPLYNYYFFPLKSFASELQGDHHQQQQQTAIVPMYAATETAENTQKQLMNPLFVAIGTFISMALLFMMGVLFLPKLPHLTFNARVADNDDFPRLTTFVMNAIDRRNRWGNFTTAS